MEIGGRVRLGVLVNGCSVGTMAMNDLAMDKGDAG